MGREQILTRYINLLPLCKDWQRVSHQELRWRSHRDSPFQRGYNWNGVVHRIWNFDDSRLWPFLLEFQVAYCDRCRSLIPALDQRMVSERWTEAWLFDRLYQDFACMSDYKSHEAGENGSRWIDHRWWWDLRAWFCRLSLSRRRNLWTPNDPIFPSSENRWTLGTGSDWACDSLWAERSERVGWIESIDNSL